MTLEDASPDNVFWFWLFHPDQATEKWKSVCGPLSFDGSNLRKTSTEPTLIYGQRSADDPDEKAFWIKRTVTARLKAFYRNSVDWTDAKIVESVLTPGQRFARISRPSGFLSSTEAAYLERGISHELQRSASQLVSLVERVSLLCQYIHPCEANFATYGLEARNILILAATEAEVQFRSVLVANGLGRERYTTKDFVQLLRPMYLDVYRIGYSHYPWLAPMDPFANWDTECPTRSLDWYDAYNSVKHDREGNFPEANLLYALRAVSACFILLCAQFGEESVLESRSEIGRFFDVYGPHQTISFEEENKRGIYVPGPKLGQWEDVRLSDVP